MTTSPVVTGFITGLKSVRRSDEEESDRRRIELLLDLVCYQSLDLDDHTLHQLISSMRTFYFSGGSGSLWIGTRLREVLENPSTRIEYPREKTLPLLCAFGKEVCRDLDNSSTPLHQITARFARFILWLAGEIRHTDPILASRLMRTCGKRMKGFHIDEFFWELKGMEGCERHKWSWALVPLSEGMLFRENLVDILTNHLLHQDRGPEIDEDRSMEERPQSQD
ncbi:MAG TPA: hypothetical protein PK263_02295 [bacterium]|nr:hypothetical protein [bacterium]